MTFSLRSADHFCDTFDLTSRIPMSAIDEVHTAKRLIPLNLNIDNDLASSMDGLVKQIKHVLATTPSTEVVRLCIAALGAPEWGEHYPAVGDTFLSGCNSSRHTGYIALFVCLAPSPASVSSRLCMCFLCSAPLHEPLGRIWMGPEGRLGDRCNYLDVRLWWCAYIEISCVKLCDDSPAANPALTSLFPSHHGLVQIHKLPAPHSILPTSDKYSTLRGLSSSAAANIGTGENNLAFRCMRKRLIFETMHLDLEGGVTERRTTPSSTVSAIGSDVGQVPTRVANRNTASFARVAVEFEETLVDMKNHSLEGHVSSQSTESGATDANSQKLKKLKKKVAFHSDKPDLYDF